VRQHDVRQRWLLYTAEGWDARVESKAGRRKRPRHNARMGLAIEPRAGPAHTGLRVTLT